jgi:hypothetical protein
VRCTRGPVPADMADCEIWVRSRSNRASACYRWGMRPVGAPVTMARRRTCALAPEVVKELEAHEF